MMSNDQGALLARAYSELEAELADPFRRALRAVRKPELRWLRLATGTTFIAAGCMAFLPVLGIELLPLGLLLVAEDIPWLQDPAARAVLWLLRVWRSFKAWCLSWLPDEPSAPAH
jgi:hypothetical protein